MKAARTLVVLAGALLVGPTSALASGQWLRNRVPPAATSLLPTAHSFTTTGGVAALNDGNPATYWKENGGSLIFAVTTPVPGSPLNVDWVSVRIKVIKQVDPGPGGNDSFNIGLRNGLVPADDFAGEDASHTNGAITITGVGSPSGEIEFWETFYTHSGGAFDSSTLGIVVTQTAVSTADDLRITEAWIVTRYGALPANPMTLYVDFNNGTDTPDPATGAGQGDGWDTPANRAFASIREATVDIPATLDRNWTVLVRGTSAVASTVGFLPQNATTGLGANFMKNKITGANTITIQADTGHRPRIEPAFNNHCFMIQGTSVASPTSNVTIKGFSFKVPNYLNRDALFLYRSCSSITFEDNIVLGSGVTDAGTIGVEMEIVTGDPAHTQSNITFRGNVFGDLGKYAIDLGDGVDDDLTVSNVAIERNIFFNNGQAAIYYEPNVNNNGGHTVTNNTFHDNATVPVVAGDSNSEIWVDAIDDNSVTIKNNIFQVTADASQVFIAATGASAVDVNDASDFNYYYDTAVADDHFRAGAAARAWATWKGYGVDDTAGTGSTLDTVTGPKFENAAGRDYHLKSQYGFPTRVCTEITSAKGILDEGITGLTWERAVAADHSPAIDKGDTAAAFTTEREDNGNRLDAGAYGNTPSASKSLASSGELNTKNFWTGDVSKNWYSHGNWAHGIPGDPATQASESAAPTAAAAADARNTAVVDPSESGVPAPSLDPNPVAGNNAPELALGAAPPDAVSYSLTVVSGELKINHATAGVDLDVGAGGVSITGGTLTHSTQTIFVAGNWSKTGGTFTASGGTVQYDGTAAGQTIAAGGSSFNNVTIANGAAYTVSTTADMTVAGTLKLNAGVGTFLFDASAASRSLTIGTGSASGTVDLDGGTFRLSGSATTTATLTRAGAGFPFAMDVASGATIDFNRAAVTGPNSAGIVVNAGAIVDRLDNTTFSSVAASGGIYLDLSAQTMAHRNNIPVSFNGVSFVDASGSYNVKTGLKTPLILVTGDADGETYDNDPADMGGYWTGRIVFDEKPVRNLDLGGGTDYASFELAIAAASDTHRIVQMNRWPLATRLDYNSVNAANVVLHRAHLWARAPTQFVIDDNAKEITLRNCVVSKGSVDNVVLEHCALYDPDAGATVEVTGSDSRNSILDDGTPGLTVDSTNTYPGADSLFVNAPSRDFHLAAGSAAIDAGTTVTTVADDWEGHARPQGANKDRGADEFVTAVTAGTVPEAEAETGATKVQLGDIAQQWNVFRGDGRYTFAVTRGGSPGGTYDNRLVLLRRRGSGGAGDLEVMATFDTVDKPIHGMLYSSVDGGPGATTEHRIFLLVDTNSDGTADGIMALIDTIDVDTIAPPVNFSTADFKNFTPQDETNRASWYDANKIYVDRSFDGGGDGILTPGAAGGDKLHQLIFRTVATDGDTSVAEPANSKERKRWRKRLFFVSNKTLYKVNADPLDTVGTTYGQAYAGWTTAGDYDWQGRPWAHDAQKYVWIPVSSAAGNTLCLRYTWDGTSSGAASQWDGPDASNNENRFGPTLVQGSGNAASSTLIIGASDGRRVMAFRTDAASNTNLWTTDLTPAGKRILNGPPLRPIPLNYNAVFVGYGDRLEKLNAATGAQAWTGAASPPTAADDDGDQAQGDSVIPSFGNLSTNLDYLTFNGTTHIFWGTERGYGMSFKVNLNESAEALDATEGPDVGFPYHLGGDAVTNAVISYEGVANGWYIVYSTKSGRVLKFKLQ